MTWQEIKAAGKAFPQEKVALVAVTIDGEPRTGWINTGYKNYPHKEYCETMSVLTVEFEDMNGVSEQDIQLYFIEEMNKVCVSHMISRIPTDFGIEMLFYFEDREKALAKFNELYESEDKLVDFGCSLQSDPEWETIEGMMETYG
ncbi:MAG: hypothetical protein ACSHWW_06565 [Nonlabens sp.]|uniref:hypothetical protein n=1 Tax=Nonlabens sp. TaxID=1888209 RepID=UPI003EF18F8A